MFNFPAEARSTLWWCSVYGDQQYVTLTLKYLYQRNLDPPIVMTKMEPKTLIFQPSCNVFEPFPVVWPAEFSVQSGWTYTCTVPTFL